MTEDRAQNPPSSSIQSPSRPHRRVVVLLFLLLSAGALVPLFVCSPLPLNDYPDHVARMHIIAEFSHSPALRRYYAVDWQPLPNLAMDVLVPPLARVTSAETASWLFVALALLLMASGAIALHVALFGKFSLLPLCSFLLLYNREVLWGFLNFAFAVGLSLWLFAAWVRFRTLSAHWRVPLFTLLGLMLYFAHIHAFCTYALMVGAYELSVERTRLRARPTAAAQALFLAFVPFITPLLLFMLYSTTSKLAGYVSYGSLLDKLSRLLAPFNNYSPTLDIATFLFCGGLLAYGMLSGRLSIHRHMRLPLAVLVVAFLMLPQQLYDAWAVDRRVVLILSLVLVGSLTERSALTKRSALFFPRGRYIVVALVALFALRTGIIVQHWHKAHRIYQEHLSLIDRVERGSRLASIVVGPDRPHLADPPLWELPSLAVQRKDVYTNAIFAEEGHHILRVREKPSPTFYRSPSQKFMVETEGTTTRLERDPYQVLPRHAFDYVYLVNERLLPSRRPPWLELIEARGNAALYRIQPH